VGSPVLFQNHRRRYTGAGHAMASACTQQKVRWCAASGRLLNNTHQIVEWPWQCPSAKGHQLMPVASDAYCTNPSNPALDVATAHTQTQEALHTLVSTLDHMKSSLVAILRASPRDKRFLPVGGTPLAVYTPQQSGTRVPTRGFVRVSSADHPIVPFLARALCRHTQSVGIVHEQNLGADQRRSTKHPPSAAAASSVGGSSAHGGSTAHTSGGGDALTLNPMAGPPTVVAVRRLRTRLQIVHPLPWGDTPLTRRLIPRAVMYLALIEGLQAALAYSVNIASTPEEALTGLITFKATPAVDTGAASLRTTHVPVAAPFLFPPNPDNASTMYGVVPPALLLTCSVSSLVGALKAQLKQLLTAADTSSKPSQTGANNSTQHEALCKRVSELECPRSSFSRLVWLPEKCFWAVMRYKEDGRGMEQEALFRLEGDAAAYIAAHEGVAPRSAEITSLLGNGQLLAQWLAPAAAQDVAFVLEAQRRMAAHVAITHATYDVLSLPAVCARSMHAVYTNQVVQRLAEGAGESLARPEGRSGSSHQRNMFQDVMSMWGPVSSSMLRAQLAEPYAAVNLPEQLTAGLASVATGVPPPGPTPSAPHQNSILPQLQWTLRWWMAVVSAVQNPKREQAIARIGVKREYLKSIKNRLKQRLPLTVQSKATTGKITPSSAAGSDSSDEESAVDKLPGAPLSEEEKGALWGELAVQECAVSDVTSTAIPPLLAAVAVVHTAWKPSSVCTPWLVRSRGMRTLTQAMLTAHAECVQAASMLLQQPMVPQTFASHSHWAAQHSLPSNLVASGAPHAFVTDAALTLQALPYGAAVAVHTLLPLLRSLRRRGTMQTSEPPSTSLQSTSTDDATLSLQSSGGIPQQLPPTQATSGGPGHPGDNDLDFLVPHDDATGELDFDFGDIDSLGGGDAGNEGGDMSSAMDFDKAFEAFDEFTGNTPTAASQSAMVPGAPSVLSPQGGERVVVGSTLHASLSVILPVLLPTVEGLLTPRADACAYQLVACSLSQLQDLLTDQQRRHAAAGMSLPPAPVPSPPSTLPPSHFGQAAALMTPRALDSHGRPAVEFSSARASTGDTLRDVVPAYQPQQLQGQGSAHLRPISRSDTVTPPSASPFTQQDTRVGKVTVHLPSSRQSALPQTDRSAAAQAASTSIADSSGPAVASGRGGTLLKSAADGIGNLLEAAHMPPTEGATLPYSLAATTPAASSTLPRHVSHQAHSGTMSSLPPPPQPPPASTGAHSGSGSGQLSVPSQHPSTGTLSSRGSSMSVQLPNTPDGTAGGLLHAQGNVMHLQAGVVAPRLHTSNEEDVARARAGLGALALSLLSTAWHSACVHSSAQEADVLPRLPQEIAAGGADSDSEDADRESTKGESDSEAPDQIDAESSSPSPPPPRTAASTPQAPAEDPAKGGGTDSGSEGTGRGKGRKIPAELDDRVLITSQTAPRNWHMAWRFRLGTASLVPPRGVVQGQGPRPTQAASTVRAMLNTLCTVMPQMWKQLPGEFWSVGGGSEPPPPLGTSEDLLIGAGDPYGDASSNTGGGLLWLMGALMCQSGMTVTKAREAACAVQTALRRVWSRAHRAGDAAETTPLDNRMLRALMAESPVAAAGWNDLIAQCLGEELPVGDSRPANMCPESGVPATFPDSYAVSAFEQDLMSVVFPPLQGSVLSGDDDSELWADLRCKSAGMSSAASSPKSGDSPTAPGSVLKPSNPLTFQASQVLPGCVGFGAVRGAACSVVSTEEHPHDLPPQCLPDAGPLASLLSSQHALRTALLVWAWRAMQATSRGGAHSSATPPPGSVQELAHQVLQLSTTCLELHFSNDDADEVWRSCLAASMLPAALSPFPAASPEWTQHGRKQSRSSNVLNRNMTVHLSRQQSIAAAAKLPALLVCGAPLVPLEMPAGATPPVQAKGGWVTETHPVSSPLDPISALRPPIWRGAAAMSSSVLSRYTAAAIGWLTDMPRNARRLLVLQIAKEVTETPVVLDCRTTPPVPPPESGTDIPPQTGAGGVGQAEDATQAAQDMLPDDLRSHILYGVDRVSIMNCLLHPLVPLAAGRHLLQPPASVLHPAVTKYISKQERLRVVDASGWEWPADVYESASRDLRAAVQGVRTSLPQPGMRAVQVKQTIMAAVKRAVHSISSTQALDSADSPHSGKWGGLPATALQVQRLCRGDPTQCPGCRTGTTHTCNFSTIVCRVMGDGRIMSPVECAALLLRRAQGRHALARSMARAVGGQAITDTSVLQDAAEPTAVQQSAFLLHLRKQMGLHSVPSASASSAHGGSPNELPNGSALQAMCSAFGVQCTLQRPKLQHSSHFPASTWVCQLLHCLLDGLAGRRPGFSLCEGLQFDTEVHPNLVQAASKPVPVTAERARDTAAPPMLKGIANTAQAHGVLGVTPANEDAVYMAAVLSEISDKVSGALAAGETLTQEACGGLEPAQLKELVLSRGGAVPTGGHTQLDVQASLLGALTTWRAGVADALAYTKEGCCRAQGRSAWLLRKRLRSQHSTAAPAVVRIPSGICAGDDQQAPMAKRRRPLELPDANGGDVELAALSGPGVVSACVTATRPPTPPGWGSAVSGTAVPLEVLSRRARYTTGTLHMGRSSIDGAGLFATSRIPLDDVVGEYVGEVVSGGVCELREGKYDTSGVADYMFRIGQHEVIDASLFGGRARYINHSCDPNCYAVATLPVAERSTNSSTPAGGELPIDLWSGGHIFPQQARGKGYGGVYASGDPGGRAGARALPENLKFSGMRVHTRTRRANMERRRVFVYAGKGISRGEELTYDYQFPQDEKLVTCKCGTPACRGTLNITATQADKK